MNRSIFFWIVGALLAFNVDLALASPRPLGSIGTYSNGCLDSDETIDGTETGLHKLFIERRRFYANPELADLLRSLGQAYEQEWVLNGPALPDGSLPYERIQLGDISQKGGGRMTRHASHQIGLDVDIVYMRKNHRETKADRGAGVGFDEVFVHNHKVSSNLDGVRTWWLFRFLAASGKVDRIFVDPAVKNYFCQHALALPARDRAERVAVLRDLRPYPDHDDHFHLRLKCPPEDVKCIASPRLPAGSGCGKVGIGAEEDAPADLTAWGIGLDVKRPPAECESIVPRSGNWQGF